MKELKFSVPWAALISDNRKFVKGYILSSEYRAAKELIGQFAIAAARKNKWERHEGPLSMTVIVREPDRRRRDLQSPEGPTGWDHHIRKHLVGRQPSTRDTLEV